MKICSVDDIKTMYIEGEFADIAKNLPHLRQEGDPLIQFLMASSLLRMKDWLTKELVTIGADPEFIVCKRGTTEVVLFSSIYATDQ